MALPLSRLLVAVVTAFVLAACAGPVVQPPPSAAPPAQPPAAEPTRGNGAQESPLPQAEAKPVLTTAVAGTGAGNLVAPDTVCVFWTWGGQGLPPLTDGLSFSVDHAVVEPATWSASREACGDSGSGVQWCGGAQITVEDSTCVVGFVRSGTPATQALVGLVGTMQCTLSGDQCTTALQAIDDAPDLSPDLDLEAVAGSGG